MEQLNINQLRNLWLRSANERLASWRDFRIQLQSKYVKYNGTDSVADNNILLSCLNTINTWWLQAPIVNLAMDPFNPESWPTVWEILDDGECCKYSRGLAMAYTIYYMSNSKCITIDRVHDHMYNDDYMIANFDGKYILNSPYNKIIDIQKNNQITICDSVNIESLLMHEE